MKSRKICMLGMFTACAMILSYVESLLPINLGVPGAKPGFPNVVIVMALYCMGAWEALGMNCVRILLTGFLFGSVFGMLYSFAGAILSFLGMLLVKKIKGITVLGVSVIGGILHNLGQLAVAIPVLATGRLILLAPYLILAGVAAGLLVGTVNRLTLPYVQKRMEDR
ncbi:MAG: Gx transporter family protein [Lachnospiraceae bacterium]